MSYVTEASSAGPGAAPLIHLTDGFAGKHTQVELGR